MKSFALKIDPLTGEELYEVYLTGQRLLEDPLLNKGAGFNEEERQAFGLTGLLRAAVNTLQQQVDRTLENYRQKSTNLERYIYLQALQDRNETLFHALLAQNLKEMMPIVYTPVVGEACLHMSHIMRRYRGVYLDPENIAQIDQILASVSRPEISLVVATDGERILGLGDLGSDGMGIPVGKVNLYVAAAGLHPTCCLPVCLDVGTNNEELLRDPMYLGWRHPRLSGTAYYDFIERFVVGLRRALPSPLLQWEDFGKHHAFNLLERYRERILSFNDDIQGTGATALAALMTAARIKGGRLADERFVVAGMGQAGVGIARNIRARLAQDGLSDGEIRRRVLAVDAAGLLLEDTPGLEETQRAFAQPRDAVSGWRLASPDRITLLDVVANGGATALIGVAGMSGLFGADVLGALARNTDRPVVMALSNPTAKSECRPQAVAEATDGRGLVATGSPFDPVVHRGIRLQTSQCNNLYVFPGVGLGVLVSRALKVTDRMFLAASEALSAMVSPGQREAGVLLPDMDDIRRVSFEVALAVAREARDSGLGRLLDDERLGRLVSRAQWTPHYYPYRPGARHYPR